jgi:hypothetical protein
MQSVRHVGSRPGHSTFTSQHWVPIFEKGGILIQFDIEDFG